MDAGAAGHFPAEDTGIEDGTHVPGGKEGAFRRSFEQGDMRQGKLHRPRQGKALRADGGRHVQGVGYQPTRHRSRKHPGREGACHVGPRGIIAARKRRHPGAGRRNAGLPPLGRFRDRTCSPRDARRPQEQGHDPGHD